MFLSLDGNLVAIWEICWFVQSMEERKIRIHLDRCRFQIKRFDIVNLMRVVIRWIRHCRQGGFIVVDLELLFARSDLKLYSTIGHNLGHWSLHLLRFLVWYLSSAINSYGVKPALIRLPLVDVKLGVKVHVSWPRMKKRNIIKYIFHVILAILL